MMLSRRIYSSGRYYGVAALLAIVLSAGTSEAGVKRYTTGMIETSGGITIYLNNTGAKDIVYSVTIAAPNPPTFAYNLPDQTLAAGQTVAVIIQCAQPPCIGIPIVSTSSPKLLISGFLAVFNVGPQFLPTTAWKLFK